MVKKNKKTVKEEKNTSVEDNRKQVDVAEEMQDEKKPESDKDESNEELLQQKVDELNDKYLRLYSEYDNYRKRTIREKLDLVKTASEEVISDMLTILDDMERAIKSTEETENCVSVKEGFILIYNKMQSILEKKGLKPIEAVGQPFDTDYHEAITYIPAPKEKLKGKIVEEVEKGYTLNDKVIRYTKAVIGQ